MKQSGVIVFLMFASAISIIAQPATNRDSQKTDQPSANVASVTFDNAGSLSQTSSANNQSARQYEIEAEGEELRSSRFNDLAAAANAIGNSETNLLVNKNIVCNSKVDWPAQSVIKFTGRGRIVYAAGCALTFKGVGIEASPNRQLVSGFMANAAAPPIKWDTTYPDQISFKWFGGSATATGASNSNAWRLMFDAMAAPIGDGTNPKYVQQGALVYLPPSTSACYVFDDTAQITKPVILRGGASAGWYRNTCLSFPKGKTGLYINGVNTWLAPYSSTAVNAGFSTIENITVIGGGYKYDAPAAPVDMSVNATSGSLVVRRNASDSTHTFGQDVAGETTVTINRYSYAIARKDSPTQITLQKPRLFVQVKADSSVVRMVSGLGPHTLSGSATVETSDWNGQQIEIDAKLYTIASLSHDAKFNQTIINLTSNYSGTTNATGTNCINSESPCHQGTATVQSLNSLSAQNLWINNAHGIDAKAQVTLRNFHVRYFSGNGVHISTSTMPRGAASCQNCVNQNNSYIARGMIYNTAGHGIALFGQETNNIEVNSVDVSVVKGACFLLGSFLGSVYSTTHCAVSEMGSFYNPFGIGAAGSNRIKDSYVESGEPSNLLSQHDRADETGGGLDPHSAGVETYTSSSFFNVTNLQVRRDYPFNNPGTVIRLGTYSNGGATPTSPVPAAIIQFGTTEDPENVAAGGSNRQAAPVNYFSYFPSGSGLDGWWGWSSGNLAARTYLAIASGAAQINNQDAEKITGVNARSQIWFPHGFWLGSSSRAMRRVLSASAVPESGQYFKGEVVFNQNTNVGGNAGWVNTAKGTPGPGTWNTFGWIYSGVSGVGTHQIGATINNPTIGQVLQWDGSKWVNATLPGAMLSKYQFFASKQLNTGASTLDSVGNAINRILRGSARLDFPSINAQSCQSLNMTLAGAVVGDETTIGLPIELSGLAGVSWTAAITAPNTVTISGCNATTSPTSDPSPAMVKVTIIQ